MMCCEPTHLLQVHPLQNREVISLVDWANVGDHFEVPVLALIHQRVHVPHLLPVGCARGVESM